MRNIEDYNWDDLYEKVENFIRGYIPDANVNKLFITEIQELKLPSNRKATKLLSRLSTRNHVSDLLADTM